jgi:putative transposase
MSHSVFVCDFHLVWPTKYRKSIFNDEAQGYIKEFIKSWREYHPDVIIKQLVLASTACISYSLYLLKSIGIVARTLKSVTTKALNEKFPHLKKVY